MRKAKTMRDIWDEKRKDARKQKESAVFPGSRRPLGKHTTEGFAKTQRYLLEHLKLKKVVMDFFPDYQRYLGGGGFTKI